LDLYHISKYELKIGDLIHPYEGDKQFQEIISMFVLLLENFPDEALNIYYRYKLEGKKLITHFIEAFLEVTRKREFPEKPLRLEACYFFPEPLYCVAFWKWYREKSNNKPGFIYQCEEKEIISYHKGDMLLLNNDIDSNLSNEENLNKWFSISREYWKADQKIFMPEILINGEVIVKKILPKEEFDKWYPKFKEI
jgi:hypothetical protein